MSVRSEYVMPGVRLGVAGPSNNFDMTIAGLVKRRSEQLRQVVDLSRWLDGATIALFGGTVTSTSDGSPTSALTLTLEHDAATPNLVSFLFFGGHIGVTYIVRYHIETSDGRFREDEISLRVDGRPVDARRNS